MYPKFSVRWMILCIQYCGISLSLLHPVMPSANSGQPGRRQKNENIRSSSMTFSSCHPLPSDCQEEREYSTREKWEHLTDHFSLKLVSTASTTVYRLLGGVWALRFMVLWIDENTSTCPKSLRLKFSYTEIPALFHYGIHFRVPVRLKSWPKSLTAIM